MDEFPLKEIHYVFNTDSLECSRPVSHPVQYPDEIKRAFRDLIAYDKGASIVRMMVNFLGIRTGNLANKYLPQC